jgi:hypothetical protein
MLSAYLSTRGGWPAPGRDGPAVTRWWPGLARAGIGYGILVGGIEGMRDGVLTPATRVEQQ